MKQKKKRAILAGIAIFAMVAMSVPVFAAPGSRPLPGENEPFWTIFAQMDSPTDTADCMTAATSYVNSQNFSDDQKQGEMIGYTEMCTGFASMPSEMQSDMATEGVTSNLFSAPDWHHVENLYFEKNGMGKIQFTNTIDFMSYRFMTFMSIFPDTVQFNDGYISLNASMMGEMKSYGAQLTMYGLNFSQIPDIYVTDANGTMMHKATDSDVNAVSYNADTGELTFNATHFSSFKAVTKGSKVKKMKISSVEKKIIKYRAGKTFNLTVKGKNLFKKGSDVSCMMGFQQAEKIHAGRAGNRVKCTFGMDSFSSRGTFPLTITVSGQGEVTKVNAVRVK
ncbi:MAG: hypothetical protein NT093_01180 [Candidatus Moranbacteria bacterium]|nr:hypothetical protein [Candidatus Moranbacteria bacterium]